jgi:hypothetical protein
MTMLAHSITRHWTLCAYPRHAAEASGQCGEDRGAHDSCVVIVITAARQTSARSYRPHVGLARQIPVGNSPLCAAWDHLVRRRSKGK